MSDARATLERIGRRVPVPQPAYERLMRRRDHKRRTERIVTVIVALLLALAAVGGAVRLFRGSLRQVPADRIDRTNVARLGLEWSAKLDGAATTVRFRSLGYDAPYAPTVADGTVFVGTDSGKLYAFDASCGGDGAPCDPEWVATTDGAIPSPPTVADGIVYVGAQGGGLYAFPAACGSGGAECRPLWVGNTRRAVQSPVVVDGVVYAMDAVNGTVYAFGSDCGTDGETCTPLWTVDSKLGPVAPAFVPSQVPWRPAVFNGVVYAVLKGGKDAPQLLYALDARTGKRLWLASAPPFHSLSPYNTPLVVDAHVLVNLGGLLQAFPVQCRTDGGRCRPDWTFDQGAWLASDDGVVFTNGWNDFTSGTLYALPADCASQGASCDALWTAADQGWGEVAAGEGMVFVTSNNGDALEAYPADCASGGGSCQPEWKATSLGAPRWAPVVADGVVYVGSQDGSLNAFSVSCGTGGETCAPLWSRRAAGSAISPPTIVGSRLFAASFDGKLFAFALPDAASRDSSSGSSAPTAVFYLGLAALVAILLVLRDRRRPTSTR